MPDGKDVSFAGGELDTAMIDDALARAAVELEMKKIANQPSSMVYTMEKPIIGPEESAVVSEVVASATAGFDSVNRTPAGTKTVAIPQAKAPQPTVNAALAAGGAVETVAPMPLADATAKARAALSAASNSTPAPK